MALIVVSTLTAGCTGSGSRADSAGEIAGGIPDGTVLVFAAASLTDAFAEVEAAFEDQHPGVDVRLNLAGSAGLREQILGGAPADVYASASQSTMEQVVAAGATSGTPRVFAGNRLQIAVPAGNPAGIVGLDDFGRDDLLIGLCDAGVPCGEFAREALAKAGVEPLPDTNEADVRALLTKLGAGELDAGITYVTDVQSADGLVEGIDLPPDRNVVAEYPIASLASSENLVAAQEFVDFVLSDDGRQILGRWGFDVP